MNNRFPRWLALGVWCGLAATALAGCSDDDRPAGIDGDLTGAWGGFGDPVPFLPAVQACHSQAFTASVALADYRPVTCDQQHLAETVHVGTFAGAAAELEAPPAPDSAEQRAAYQECDQRATEYLGGDFRQGRLWLGVAAPTEPGWQGGARWFRCELVEVESVYGDQVPREGSLAGTLSGDSGLKLGCYAVAVADGAVEQMSPVGCDEVHQAEFVGVWRAPSDAYPDPADGDAETQVYEGCREQVAAYVSVPADGDLVYRTGTIADWMSRQDWDAGDRAFRCYLWLPEQELTESMREAGTDALPVQTE